MAERPSDIRLPEGWTWGDVERQRAIWGISDEDWAILELGPDTQDAEGRTVCNESYWDAWTEVCDNAVVTDENGHKYTVWQEGDCWLIPEGMEWNDETDTFDWPEDRESDETEDEEGE